MAEMSIPPKAPLPAPTPGIAESIYDGMILGDYSDNDSAVKVGAQIFTGVIPFVGQAADIRDITAALGMIRRGEQGGLKSLILSAIGFVPGLGDLIKSMGRIGVKPTLRAIVAFLEQTGRAWRLLRSSASLAADGAIKYGQRLGSDIYRLGYDSSQLFRRTADGLSEGWKLFKKDGFSGFLEGWKAPLKSDQLDLKRLEIEENLVLPNFNVTAFRTGVAVLESGISQDPRGSELGPPPSEF